jgi:hypothetical protein
LRPQLIDLASSQAFNVPSRFDSLEEAIEALAELFEAQLLLLGQGSRQTMDGLAAATNRSGAQVHELLAAVEDWEALVYGLRFRPSDRGSVGLDKSVLIIKTAPWQAKGPNVFPACSPAYPKEISEVLADHGLCTGSTRSNDDATDSALYLIESNPLFCLALGSVGLPEGTQWDHENTERYPAEISEEIEEVLQIIAGSEYETRTSKILETDVIGQFVANRARHRPEDRRTLRVESGCVCSSMEGESRRFLGGELDMVRFLQKSGLLPFLDLPHSLVPGPMLAESLDCTFKVDDGRIIAGDLLTWSAKSTFGICNPPPNAKDVFVLVKKAILQMAGADPEAVEYAVARARVGKKDARKRLGVGLLVRNDGGALSGWGIPGFDCNDDQQVRQAIAYAEQNAARMRPDGAVQETIERLQDAGLQRTGVKLADHRHRREGLIRAADVLRIRALLGV